MNTTQQNSAHAKDRATQGITVVEVIVAVGIVSLVAVFAAVTISQLVTSRLSMLHETEQMYAAEAGHEMVRFLRDADWDTFAALDLNQTHYLAVGTSTIAFTDTEETVTPHLTRQLYIEPLYRATDGTVVAATATGATNDADGRVVTVEAVGPHGTTTFASILTNLFSQ